MEQVEQINQEQKEGQQEEGQQEEEKKDYTVVDIYDRLLGDASSEMATEKNVNVLYETDLISVHDWNFNDMYVKSNSPMASNCTSDVEPDQEEDDMIHNDFPLSQSFIRKKIHRNLDTTEEYTENRHNRHPMHIIDSPKKYKKFTYEDIEKSLSKYYDKNETNFTEMDLLVTYLRGMRMVYLISKNITHFKSYSIAMATLSITICLAVIAPFVKNMYWGAYLISSGNALATVLLSLSRYFKFDANSAQYSFLEKQFNRMETQVDNLSTMNKSTYQRFHIIESKLTEMNDYIQNLIPDEVVQLFPLIYRTNIIQFIRKIELHRRNLIIRLRDIKNEIHYILYKWNSSDEMESKDINLSVPPEKEKEKNRIIFLMNMKENTKKELLQYKHIYNQIDKLFKNEIRYAETHQTCYGCSSLWKPTYDFSKLSPIVRDYLKSVIPD